MIKYRIILVIMTRNQGFSITGKSINTILSLKGIQYNEPLDHIPSEVKNIKITEYSVRYELYTSIDDDGYVIVPRWEQNSDYKYTVMRNGLVWPEKNLNEKEEGPIFSFYGSTPEEIEEGERNARAEEEEEYKKRVKKGWETRRK